MHDLIKTGALSALCVFIAGAVSAADLKGAPRGSVKDDLPPVYAAPAYASTYNWTGLYTGAFIGGAHGLWTVDFYRNNNHGHAELGADGFAGGGWVGYNYQLPNNFVIGLEADLGATNAKQTNETFDNDTTLSSYGLIGSLRARAGYAFDRLLVFATAGFAFANISNEIQKGRNAGEEVVWDDQTATGYALGAGLEYAMTNNWILRGEYLYSNYGTVNLVNRDGNKAEFTNELHLIRTGLSYKF